MINESLHTRHHLAYTAVTMTAKESLYDDPAEATPVPARAEREEGAVASAVGSVRGAVQAAEATVQGWQQEVKDNVGAVRASIQAQVDRVLAFRLQCQSRQHEVFPGLLAVWAAGYGGYLAARKRGLIRRVMVPSAAVGGALWLFYPNIFYRAVGETKVQLQTRVPWAELQAQAKALSPWAQAGQPAGKEEGK